MLRWASELARTRPLTLACVTSCAKATAADAVVQTCVERRAELARERSCAFALFGFVWMGAGQYLVYVRILDSLLPRTTNATAVAKVVLDQFIHVPLVFMPLFYLTDGWVEAVARGEEVLACLPHAAHHASYRYKREIRETMLANWQIWLPAQFVCFRLVPGHLRVPYVACVSFVWTMVLSVLQGKFARLE